MFKLSIRGQLEITINQHVRLSWRREEATKGRKASRTTPQRAKFGEAIKYGSLMTQNAPDPGTIDDTPKRSVELLSG